MGKAVSKRKAGPAPKHVRLYWWLLRSEAYLSLSPRARCLLVELYAAYNGSNNGDVFLSVRDAAERLNVGKTTIAPCFHELEGRGFIRAYQRGNFAWKLGHATTWVLTEYELAGQPPTKDFMSWRSLGIQKPVRRSGRTVRTSGQGEASKQQSCSNCPPVRTDFAALRARQSARSDTVSMPRRGAKDDGAESRAQPEGERSAANAPQPLGDLLPRIVATALRTRAPFAATQDATADNFVRSTRARARIENK